MEKKMLGDYGMIGVLLYVGAGQMPSEGGLQLMVVL
jgi:hypothetical protein